MPTDPDDEELFDDTSTQVKLSVEILTHNSKLTPQQRKALHDLTVKAARQLSVQVMLVTDRANVVASRISSVSGTRKIDYREG